MVATFRWLAPVATLGVLACTSQEPPAPKPAPKKSNPSAWKEIETPVPVGKKLPCGQILAADKIGDAVGYKLDLVDESARDPDATSVCRLMTAATKTQAKGRAEKDREKGVPIGDELATVSVYCWYPWTVPEIKKKCADAGDEILTDVGDMACVRKLKAGDFQRHLITALEPDTRCKLVVNPGPSNYDLALTKATAKAVIDTVDKDSLKPQAPR
jgi:hypothetical protein